MTADPQNPSSPSAPGCALPPEADSAGRLCFSREAVAPSPGFVHGHCMLGFAGTHEGDPQRLLAAAIDHVTAPSAQARSWPRPRSPGPMR